MAGVNLPQKVVVAVGAVLSALRVAFPVKDEAISGVKFSLEKGLSQGVDWNMTLLHIGGVVIAAVAAFIILKKR